MVYTKPPPAYRFNTEEAETDAIAKYDVKIAALERKERSRSLLPSWLP